MTFKTLTLRGWADQLQPGQSRIISRDDLVEAAKEGLSSLLFDSVRDGDITALAQRIAREHGVDMLENVLTGDYTMSKRAASKGPFTTVTQGAGYRHHRAPTSESHGSVTFIGIRCPNCQHVFNPVPPTAAPRCPKCGYMEP